MTSLPGDRGTAAGPASAARFAQGASAALVAPMTLAAITDLYPEGPGRARGMGIYQGAVLVTASVAALIFGLSQGQQHGFGAPLTLASLAVAVALGVAFVLVERRAPAPMVPLAVLTDPSRRVALGVMFTVASVIVGYVYFITLYMQRVLHFSPLQAGLALLPATLTVMATSTLIARRAVARFGAKTVLVAAMISIGLGQVWLSQISAAGSYPVNVLAGLVLTAFGMGLLMMDNSKKREARPAVARVRTGADSRR